MPSSDAPFDTPEPISATAQVEAGSIRFIAADRLDTLVGVRPRDPKKDQDVRAADQTVWKDDASGFVRRSVSPPHPGLRGELVEGRLAAGADIA